MPCAPPPPPRHRQRLPRGSRRSPWEPVPGSWSGAVACAAIFSPVPRLSFFLLLFLCGSGGWNRWVGGRGGEVWGGLLPVAVAVPPDSPCLLRKEERRRLTGPPPLLPSPSSPFPVCVSGVEGGTACHAISARVPRAQRRVWPRLGGSGGCRRPAQLPRVTGVDWRGRANHRGRGAEVPCGRARLEPAGGCTVAGRGVSAHSEGRPGVASRGVALLRPLRDSLR